MIDSIPTIDLSEFTEGDILARQVFAEKLGKIYSEIGFVAVKNHGFDQSLEEQLYSTMESFFAMPDEVKAKYDGSHVAGQRGYTGKRKEHAAGRSVGDLKEFFHVGKYIPGREDINYMDNIWPDEISEMKDICLKTYHSLESIGREMLKAIAIYLHLPEDYFENKVNEGISILRPIHYFPIEDASELKKGAVRAAAHGDINLITILMGASAEGLEVQRRDGKWISITAVPGHLVINVGDMLERLSNNKLRSTIHRVVNPPSHEMSSSRYSIPFFMHANPNMRLDCLPTCISTDTPKMYEDISAGEFLQERLREIGLA